MPFLIVKLIVSLFLLQKLSISLAPFFSYLFIMLYIYICAFLNDNDVFLPFSWRAIMDNLMTHDKTTFRDLMSEC